MRPPVKYSLKSQRAALWSVVNGVKPRNDAEADLREEHLKALLTTLDWVMENDARIKAALAHYKAEGK